MRNTVWKYRIRAMRELLLAGVVRAMLLILGLLPERLLLWVMRLLGRWLLYPAVARAAHEQLSIGLPDLDHQGRSEIITKMTTNFGSMVAEIILTRKKGRAYVARTVKEDPSISHLEGVLAEGRGVILLTGHCGNWELSAAWGAYTLPWPVAVIGRKINNWRLNRLVDAFRERTGAIVLDRDDPPRRMVRHLQEPGVLGVVPDQDVDVLAGEFLPFFGRDAYTSTGPAALSLLSGAPIVPAFMIREGRSFRLVFHPPIRPDRNAPRRTEVTRITRAWSEAVEGMIRAHPDHWAWWHARWASTPERVAKKRSRHALKKAGLDRRRDKERS